MNKRLSLISIAVIAAVASAGCQNMTDQQRRVGTGAGVGAATGGAIGAATAGGHRGKSAATGAAVGAAVGALGGYVWNRRMEQQQAEMQSAAQGTGIDVAKTEDNRLKVNIPTDISFDTGRSEVKPGLRPVLDSFARSINGNPNATVQIVGHTDSTGGDAVNNPLSVARAQATRDYLVERGVQSSRISIDGRGEHQPIATNDTDTGRARNRRVEIFVAERA